MMSAGLRASLVQAESSLLHRRRRRRRHCRRPVFTVVLPSYSPFKNEVDVSNIAPSRDVT